MPLKSAFGGSLRPVVAKTASYTILATDNNTLFTNEGAAGTVTFTLPTAADGLKGVWFEFLTVAAQSIAVASTPADKLVVHADAAADSVTTAATIGQNLRVTCIGASGWSVASTPSAASAATAVTAVTIAT